MCWLKHPFKTYVSPNFWGGNEKHKCIKQSIHFVRVVLEEWKGYQPLIWCIPNLWFWRRTKTSKRASRWSFPYPGNLCVNWLVSSCLFATFGKRGRFEGVFFQGGKGFQAFPQIPRNYLILKRTVSFWSRKTENWRILRPLAAKTQFRYWTSSCCILCHASPKRCASVNLRNPPPFRGEKIALISPLKTMHT